MQVQVFGTKKSAETRKALRFFAERRIAVHFIDLNERGMSPREIERFAQKFGLQNLIDREGKRFKDLGLGASHLSDQRWMTKLADEPLLLKAPLVRFENKLTVGDGESDWKDWLKPQ